MLSEPSQQIQITVGNPLNIIGRTDYSVGETVSLTAVSSAPGSVTYTWNGPNGFVGAGANLRILEVGVSTSGSYSVVA